jgi:polygalacturonase
MRFQVLACTCCSATVELLNEDVFETAREVQVLLDKKPVLATKRNVFTLFGLEPDRDYELAIGKDSEVIHTRKVSYILHSSDFQKGPSDKDDTLRLQSAIMMTPKDGLLILDDGDYQVTSLYLKSHITIEFAPKARLLGSTNPEDYPLYPGEITPSDARKKPLELGTWEGNPFLSKTSLLSGYEVEDVTLVGQGLIDGQAQLSPFWNDVKHLSWSRPRLLFLVRCQHIQVIGLSFANAPCWTIHPYFSDHLEFYDLFLTNPKDSPNTDGLNPEACKDVKIIGVRFSVGDDCIALKSGKIMIGSTFKKPTQDVVIRNCFMNEGHGAIVLGSEAGAGLKNLLIERCLFKHTDRGLRIKSRRGRGKDSRMDGIVFKNIRMENVLTPLVINMFYFCDPDGKEDWVQSREKAKVDKTTPWLGHFTFENLTCLDSEIALGYFIGLPEQPIEEIVIRNSRFTVKKDAKPGYPAMLTGLEPMAKQGFLFENVRRVVLDNVKATGYSGKECRLTNVGKVNQS